MNVFKQLKKAPKVEINETNYGDRKHSPDSFYDKKSYHNKVIDGKTYDEWTEHYNVSYYRMRDRILKTGTPHPKGMKHLYNPKTTYQGKPCNWWAKKLGVTSECIRYRMLTHGHPGQPARKRKKHEHYFKGKTNREWATELGCTLNAIQKRMKINGTPFLLKKDDLQVYLYV